MGQRAEEVPSKHRTRADDALITLASRQASGNGIKKRLAEAVRYALLYVQDTRVTSTGVNQ